LDHNIFNSLAPDVPMRQTFAGVTPFFCAELVRAALLVMFPAISLFLPHLLR
jgi:TRAP-type C4-dicarboxylate transport system permease large subunit